MSIDKIPILFIDPKSKNYIDDNDETAFGKKITAVFNRLSYLFDSPLDVTLILGNKIYYYNNTSKTLKEAFNVIPNVFGYISENTDIYIENLKNYVYQLQSNNKNIVVLSNIFLSYDINEIYSANKIKMLYNALIKSQPNFCFYNELGFTPGDTSFINELKQDNHVKLLKNIKWEDSKNCAINLYNNINYLLQSNLENSI